VQVVANIPPMHGHKQTIKNAKRLRRRKWVVARNRATTSWSGQTWFWITLLGSAQPWTFPKSLMRKVLMDCIALASFTHTHSPPATRPRASRRGAGGLGPWRARPPAVAGRRFEHRLPGRAAGHAHRRRARRGGLLQIRVRFAEEHHVLFLFDHHRAA